MGKVTIKISFDATDPLYQFLVEYGSRFGHGGASIAARLMLDAAFQARPPNPFKVATAFQRQPEPAPKTQINNIDANSRESELPVETSADNRQTLLEAISEFQDSL